jgi:hypothetical protein
MADYYSIIAKAVSALDLNTEKARRRLYERARSALRSGMHSAYPRFHRSEIAAAEMSLEIAIEAVEAEAVREQNAKLAALARPRVSDAPSPPANRNGEARRSLATFWNDIRRAEHGVPGRAAMSDHREHGTDNGGHTSLTELLARASRKVDNDEQDFAPRWALTQNGGANQRRR